MAKSSIYHIKKEGKRWVSYRGKTVLGFHKKKTSASKKCISEFRKELSGK
ncbi:unnamed protein product [marine sediment metagenome]|uniref:Uncharacterized protein n=1 Tax=marine sediment metagenome TaxID=412755 RepID=X1KUR1_9ZZZZ